MACTVSLSTRRYAVLVSDRRASVDAPDQTNTPIIFIGADGVVSIGYAGAAHVGRAATDQWLAELLWGAKARRGLGFSGQAAAAGVPDAVRRIKRALDESREESDGLEILMSGFRRKPDGWLPVNLRLRRGPRKAARALDRLRLGSQGVVASAVGNPPTLPEFATALQRAAGQVSGFPSAEDSAAMLAGLVRAVAARDLGVGVDLMTTIIRPPESGPLVCRFSSLRYGTRIALQKPSLLSLSIPRLLPLGVSECSPWVISQKAVQGPAVFYGGSGLKIEADGHIVTVESGRPAPVIACSGR